MTNINFERLGAKTEICGEGIIAVSQNCSLPMLAAPQQAIKPTTSSVGAGHLRRDEPWMKGLADIVCTSQCFSVYSHHQCASDLSSWRAAVNAGALPRLEASGSGDCNRKIPLVSYNDVCIIFAGSARALPGGRSISPLWRYGRHSSIACALTLT